MTRCLLIALLGLFAVLPQQVCACAAKHTEHSQPVPCDHHDDSPTPLSDDSPAQEHDDGETPHRDCPCQCHAAPRDALAIPRSANQPDPGLEEVLPDGVVDRTNRVVPVLLKLARSDPPPGRLHTSLPLFLSVSRLLN